MRILKRVAFGIICVAMVFTMINLPQLTKYAKADEQLPEYLQFTAGGGDVEIGLVATDHMNKNAVIEYCISPSSPSTAVWSTFNIKDTSNLTFEDILVQSGAVSSKSFIRKNINAIFIMRLLQ